MTHHGNANTTIPSENRNGIRIDYLANHSKLIPELSTLLYNEWADLYQAAGLTQQDLTAALELRCTTDQLPLTLVAIAADGQLLGAGSIKLDEPGTKAGLSPWLGGIYVKANQRGLGLGALIVTALEDKARELGVSALYLSADTAEGFYLRLGWQTLERLESFGVRDVVLMSKRLV
ncbi:MAG: GNAT family N-acetyltransferase [Rheinheimera sp.]